MPFVSKQPLDLNGNWFGVRLSGNLRGFFFPPVWILGPSNGKVWTCIAGVFGGPQNHHWKKKGKRFTVATKDQREWYFKYIKYMFFSLCVCVCEKVVGCCLLGCSFGICYLPVTVQKNMKVNILTWKISESCGDEKATHCILRSVKFPRCHLAVSNNWEVLFLVTGNRVQGGTKYTSHWKEKKGTSSTSSKATS